VSRSFVLGAVYTSFFVSCGPQREAFESVTTKQKDANQVTAVLLLDANQNAIGSLAGW